MLLIRLVIVVDTEEPLILSIIEGVLAVVVVHHSPVQVALAMLIVKADLLIIVEEVRVVLRRPPHVVLVAVAGWQDVMVGE